MPPSGFRQSNHSTSSANGLAGLLMRTFPRVIKNKQTAQIILVSVAFMSIVLTVWLLFGGGSPVEQPDEELINNPQPIGPIN